ncbi:MAG: DUF1015 family protein [Ignavibacteriales bacterium]|nr:DUF1015 family protein [Ignavibacteriales bacterium]
MATVRPFKAFRPKPEFAGEVAAKPYDVLSSEEARLEVRGNPLSFLHVGKPEIDLDPAIDHYDPRVYTKGKENLQKLIDQKILAEDPAPYLYVYAQTMEGRTQYGIVGCASVEEYLNDTIKKHELTRRDKEEDRCNHVRVTNSHSGPIFLTYPDNAEIDAIVEAVTKQPPENDHVAADGIRHQSWVIRDSGTVQKLQDLFSGIRNLYVADGHHRTAAAAIVGRERKLANPNHRGDEEYNFFLAVCFPASQLKILDYNRVVKDLSGLSPEAFFEKVKKTFAVAHIQGRPRLARKGEFGLYLDGEWYLLSAPDSLLMNSDPVERLDVTIIQKHLLDPILGIKDPRVDKRIDFVGGIRGLGELEKRVDSGEMKLAICMFPTSIHELIAIADAGKIMPPKSTWFEPKLRDGLFVHFLE